MSACTTQVVLRWPRPSTSRLAAERGLAVRGLSAGTEAGARINPVAVEVMREPGISMEGQHPKQLTQAMADSASRIITMGCGVDAAACPARIHPSEDWGLDDPAGQDIETVRAIRDQIRERVERLISELTRGQTHDDRDSWLPSQDHGPSLLSRPLSDSLDFSGDGPRRRPGPSRARRGSRHHATLGRHDHRSRSPSGSS